MNLAIKGHPERGNEVIERLEMLGGINTYNLYGDESYAYYTIDGDKEIKGGIYVFGDEQLRHFTLEEFEEKFPYKVGDKVNYVKYNDDYPSVYTIQRMWWTGVTIEYLLDSSGFSALTKDLQPYREETMEEDKKVKGYCTEEPEDSGKTKKVAWFTFWDNDFADEVELYLKDRELVQKDGKWFVVKKKPQYPKTYKECCEIIHSDPNFYIDTHLHSNKLESLYKLLICRNAYWKIAGEQMGLGKAWEPDYITEDNQLVYIITTQRGYLSKNTARHWNYILAFPTEEMRDAFYENFKDLIENCKELL